MRQLLMAGLGGCIGSISRLWMSSAAYRVLGQDFPYGTLLVNVLGCLLIGFFMTFFQARFTVSPDLRIFLTVGVLGGFTTFSTFSYETVSLLREGTYVGGAANIILTLFICLLATWLGGVVGKLL